MNQKLSHSDYFILEKIPKAPIFIFSLADAAFVNSVFRRIYHLHQVPGNHLNIYEDGNFSFCQQLPALRACADEIFEKILAKPEYGLEMDRRIVKNATLFIRYNQKIDRLNLAKLSNQRLAAICQQWFFRYFHDSWTAGWPAVLVDFERNLFSNHLLDYLKQKITKSKKDLSVGNVFALLTTPAAQTYAQQENVSLLKLLQIVQKDKELADFLICGNTQYIMKQWPKIDSRSYRQFISHVTNFCWLPFMYTGPGWGPDYFISSLASLIRQQTNPRAELAKLEERGKKIIREQKQQFQILRIHGKYEKLFRLARAFVFSKSYRKDAMYYGCYVLDKVFREISRRTYLSLAQVRRIYPWEMEAVLLGRPEAVAGDTLNQRQFAIQYSTDQGRVCCEGRKAKDFYQQFSFVEVKNELPQEILGDCACVGKVRGVVRVINDPGEMKKMQPNDILVSYATSPDIMSAIRQASAIVTDLGGIICHAAIVSRELNIPCVVGTKIATQVLQDGDLVEVDASHGIVRLLGK